MFKHTSLQETVYIHNITEGQGGSVSMLWSPSQEGRGDCGKALALEGELKGGI